jgi:hypothetical protein
MPLPYLQLTLAEYKSGLQKSKEASPPWAAFLGGSNPDHVNLNVSAPFAYLVRCIITGEDRPGQTDSHR